MISPHVMSIVMMSTALVTAAVSADNIVFPEESGVINIRTMYGAVGDGVADDTAAIQKAVDEQRGRNRTLYFPNGTYLISDSIGIFNGKAHSRDRFVTYQGQSEAATVIRLKDNAPGFDDPANPKIVLSMYEGQSTGDAMHGYARHLTVDVGQGNPGAAALRFMSNNTGGMERVTIRSSDPQGAGAIGLDLRQSQNGPAFIKHVTVEGFDTGVATGNTFSLVFEHLHLRNQRVVGFDNFNARTTIRGLVSHNRVPAVRTHRHGNMTLIEAQLAGGDPQQAAIIVQTQQPRTFLRDIRAEGYGHTVQTREGSFIDGTIDEWHDSQDYALFDVPQPRTLRLPIQETPEVPWETDLSKWIKVDLADGEDVTAAIQHAVDEGASHGATTLYFPSNNKYRISGPIRIHGSINRIIGMSSIVKVEDPREVFKDGTAVFNFEDLTSDVLVVERFFLLGGWDVPSYVNMFENRTDTVIVLKNVNQRGQTKKPHPGSTWFIEDFSPGREGTIHVGEGERIWARQLNTESPRVDMTHVNGGQIWILGLKTEGRVRHLVVENGGRAELLGGVAYQSWKNQPLDPPMFVVRNAQASFTIGFYHHQTPFTTIVEETVGTQTRTLARTELATYHLPLYRSADP
jgi:hypothetical protein